MARSPGDVRCAQCGCLNFDAAHDVCESCRSKKVVFRPTARRSASTNSLSSSSNGNGKKRRIEETKQPSRSSGGAAKVTPKAAKKQPEVIDLLSSSDEEEDVEEKPPTRDLFQSRVFETVSFREKDFPSLEEAAFMRKQHAEPGKTPDKSAPKQKKTTEPKKPAAKPTAAASVSASTAKPAPAATAATPVRAASPKSPQIQSKQPASVAVKEAQSKAAQPIESKPQTPAKRPAPSAQTTQSQSSILTLTGAAQARDKSTKNDKVTQEDTPFQTRVFDTIEYQEADFATVYDGLAVARRSHPPASKAASSAASSSTATAKVVPPTAAPPLNRSTINAAKPSFPSAKPTATAKSVSETHEQGAQPSTAKSPTGRPTTPSAPARSSTTPGPQVSSVPTPAPTVASVAAATVAPAAVSSRSTEPPTVKKAVISSAQAIPSTTTTTATTPARAAVSTTPLTVSTTTPSPRPSSVPTTTTSGLTITAPAPTTMAPPPPTVAPTTMRPSTAGTTSVATSVPPAPTGTTKSSVPQTSSTASTPTVQTTEPTIVLHPTKQNPEEQRPQQTNIAAAANQTSAAVDSSPASPEAAHEFVVERPALGYCSPEFLSFMWECCGDDYTENEEVTLLEVIDLTNLSDSEGADSEAESPTGARQHHASANGHPTGTVPLANVGGSGTWYVPTLGSERQRTRPEKVICALCEESGTARLLIQCPTCTKYYHKRCARENGDETICWNCELGSMIDDSELDEEHAKHNNNEYLEYLKDLRDHQHSAVPGGDVIKEERQVVGDEQTAEPGSSADRWKAFIGEATAGVDTEYHEITNRIAAELRSEELRNNYSKGFVTREEFETQMSEVEQFYISEEERLQQLEKEKAAQRAQEAAARAAAAAEAEQTPNSQADGSITGAITPTVTNPGAIPGSSIQQPAYAANDMAPNPPSVVPALAQRVPVATFGVTSQLSHQPIVNNFAVHTTPIQQPPVAMSTTHPPPPPAPQP